MKVEEVTLRFILFKSFCQVVTLLQFNSEWYKILKYFILLDYIIKVVWMRDIFIIISLINVYKYVNNKK